MDNQNPRSNNATIGILVIAVVVLTAIGAMAFQSKSGNNMQTSVTPTAVLQGTQPTTTVTKDPAEPAAESEYKNGEYTAVGDYTSPGGEEQVGVTLTLEEGVITAVEFEPMAERPLSVDFQEKFAGGYKELVLGKNIDEVQLTKVSGSSLTPKGFNDALEKIKVEASEA